MLPHNDYFEGILQLRPATEEILAFLRKEMDTNSRFFVTKQKILKKNNIDLYVSNQKVLRQVSKKLSKKFFGIVKSSRKLHSRNRITGKGIYRVTVLFKPIELKKGMKIEHNDKIYEIMLIGNVRGNIKVQLKEEKSGKKLWVKITDLMQ